MPKVRVKKLRKIKTLYGRLNHSDYRENFDNEINDYLKKGWRIAEIKVIEAQGDNTTDVVYTRLELWG